MLSVRRKIPSNSIKKINRLCEPKRPVIVMVYNGDKINLKFFLFIDGICLTKQHTMLSKS
jgi:hypothetical protein